MKRLKSKSLAGNFYNIYQYARPPKIKAKNIKKNAIQKYFENRINMSTGLYSFIILLVHIGFLGHALFIIFNQYMKYEIVTSTRKIGTGRTKELPRITICPYYKFEENTG